MQQIQEIDTPAEAQLEREERTVFPEEMYLDGVSEETRRQLLTLRNLKDNHCWVTSRFGGAFETLLGESLGGSQTEGTWAPSLRRVGVPRSFSGAFSLKPVGWSVEEFERALRTAAGCMPLSKNATMPPPPPVVQLSGSGATLRATITVEGVLRAVLVMRWRGTGDSRRIVGIAHVGVAPVASGDAKCATAEEATTLKVFEKIGMRARVQFAAVQGHAWRSRLIDAVVRARA